MNIKLRREGTIKKYLEKKRKENFQVSSVNEEQPTIHGIRHISGPSLSRRKASCRSRELRTVMKQERGILLPISLILWE